MKKSKNSLLKLIAIVCYVIFSVLISQIIASLILSLFPSYRMNPDSNYFTVILYLLYIAISILLIYIIPTKILKKPLVSKDILGIHDFPTFTEIGLSVVGLVATYVLGVLATIIMSNFSFFNVAEEQDIGLSAIYSTPEKILTFLTVCIIVPIFEELIFRGLIYGQMRKKLGEKTWARVLSIIVVSLIFAFLHGQWNVAVTVFFLSVISCLLREFTGNINSGILLHILKNTIAFILVYLIGV